MAGIGLVGVELNETEGAGFGGHVDAGGLPPR